MKPLLDLGPDQKPRAVIADKAYDSKNNRDMIRKRGAVPVIPHRKNAKAPQKHVPKLLYRARARIERLIGKLKRFKRIALRCEKTARNFSSFIAFALACISLKSVHRA